MDDVFGAITAKDTKKITKAMKNKKADPNSRNDQGRTPLMVAVLSGDVSIVKLVHTQGKLKIDLEAENLDGCTALTCAANDGYLEITNYLLSVGADPNHQSKTGTTPLMHTSNGGYEDVARLLLEKKATVDLKSLDGWTALFHAAVGGSEQIVKLLLESGADANICSNKGWTALMCAATRGNDAVLRRLLVANANVKLANENGVTALMLAAAGGYTEACKTLLEYNAPLETRNKQGNTALDLATAAKKNDTVKMLRAVTRSAAGANSPSPSRQSSTTASTSDIPPAPTKIEEIDPLGLPSTSLPEKGPLTLSQEEQLEKEKMELIAKLASRRETKTREAKSKSPKKRLSGAERAIQASQSSTTADTTAATASATSSMKSFGNFPLVASGGGHDAGSVGKPIQEIEEASSDDEDGGLYSLVSSFGCCSTCRASVRKNA